MRHEALSHGPSPRPVVVFSDDWGRHPSSCQHIVRRMVEERVVIWVNTIGTRLPRLTADDMRRAASKVRRWIGGAEARTDDMRGPIVIDPVMWPSFRGRWQRKLNAALIGRSVTAAIERHCPRAPVVVTTVPITADLIGRVPAERWVYYMVDDLSAWPGLDERTLRTMDDQQLSKVDAAAVVSEALYERARQAGHRPRMITHGVDLERWASLNLSPRPTGDDHPALRAIAESPKPVAMYWGLIDSRIDWEAMRRLASIWPGRIVLLGPVTEQVRRMPPVKAVTMPGAVPRQLLPDAARMADVLIMPYGHSPVTHAMQPLKLMEYLATDKPVVCIDIPAANAWRECCDVTDAAHFAQRVVDRWRNGTTAHQLAMRWRRLSGESWQAKAAILAEMIDDTTRPEPRAMHLPHPLQTVPSRAA